MKIGNKTNFSSKKGHHTMPCPVVASRMFIQLMRKPYGRIFDQNSQSWVERCNKLRYREIKTIRQSRSKQPPELQEHEHLIVIPNPSISKRNIQNRSKYNAALSLSGILLGLAPSSMVSNYVCAKLRHCSTTLTLQELRFDMFLQTILSANEYFVSELII